jgi:hypothetical protein
MTSLTVLAHPEFPDGSLLVSIAETSSFSSWQGKQEL